MVDATLTRLYYSLNEPSAISGVNRLYNTARCVQHLLMRENVSDWLTKQDAYILHKPARRRLRSDPRVYVKHIDDQWSIDLCDMTNLHHMNRGFKYMLTCIDGLSKYGWAEPLGSKTGSAVSEVTEKNCQKHIGPQNV